MEKGNLSIHSENILPIIKKWLYSDSDIFVRELVSNAADAIAKLKKLSDIGEAPNVSKDEKYAIHVRTNKEAKTITFEDNGIGMTADEIREYITQIAFSGASAFLDKYKDKMGNDEIIGHFGLGFYSCFMVADKVQIDTLSFQEGAEAARWICEGGIEYEMTAGDRATRGTTITLFVGEEHEDFLEEHKLRGILTKYCNFIPVEIFLNAPDPTETPTEDSEATNENSSEGFSEDLSDAEATDNDLEDDTEVASKPEEPKPINDINPLWTKQPNECTDEEYKEFYRKVFMDFNEPLFWIHLNMDYPFRLQGILYFPKLKHELEYIEGQVKLYNNQVFVADNIKEVIPEYLLLLKGVMDCPDLPLNVSRSFLQSDNNVKKMSGYISKKVADKLNSMFKKEREQFQSYWDDISPFIKYGCIKEKDFYDKIKTSVLYKTTADNYATLTEFMERNSEKTDKTVFYVSNSQQQAQYIKMFKDQGLEAVYLTTQLDGPFMSYVESYEKDVEFNRIDSNLSDALKSEKPGEGNEDSDENSAHNEAMEELFREALSNDKLKVNVESLKSEDISAVILLPEQSRRMQEMAKNFGGGMMGMGMPMFDNEESLVLNRNHSLVKSLFSLKDNPTRREDTHLVACQLYDLALMGHKPLSNEQMTRFIERSNKILGRIAE